jgi:hypothetical protein
VAARLSSFHNGGNCALAHSDRPWPLQRLEARPDSTLGAPRQARDGAAAVGAHLECANQQCESLRTPSRLCARPPEHRGLAS